MESKKISKVTPFIMAVPSIILGIYIYMGSTIIPLTVAKITPSTEMLSYVMITGTIAGLIGPYLAGRLSDKITFRIGKRKPWVLFGGIIGSLALIGMGASTIYILLWISTFIFFLAINFYQGAYYAWMPEAVDRSQIGLVNGWGRVFSAIGGLVIFGFGIALFEMNQMYPYYMIIILTMVPVLIITFGIKEKPNTYIAERPVVEQEKKPFKENFDFLRNGAAMKLFIGAAVSLVALGIITPFMLRYFETVNGFSVSTISFALMGMVIPGLFSVFYGMIFDKFNKKLLLILGLVFECIGCIIALYVGSVAMLWVFTFVYGFGMTVFYVAYYALIPYVAPMEKLGEYMGVGNIFICIFQMIGQLLGGYVMAGSNPQLIFIIAAISIVISIIILSVGKLQLHDPNKSIEVKEEVNEMISEKL